MNVFQNDRDAWAFSVVAVFLIVFASIVIMSLSLVRAGTVRHHDCVTSDGSYVRVTNGETYECRK